MRACHDDDHRTLSIGELVRISGVSHDTLRFYEREGLLPSPPRDGGGRRRYDPRMVDQLQVIRALRDVGFPLERIRSLLSAKSENTTARSRVAAARAALAELDSALDEQQARIDAARTVISEWRAELDSGEPWPDTPLV